MRMISMVIRSLFIALFVFSSVVFGQTAKVYVSSKAGDRIAAKPDLQFTMTSPLAEPTSKSTMR